MLASLTIRDVVLIDKLDLEFSEGLGVLTGETGAGKSILLDSLGLALGERSDAGLVRPGADKLTVTAAFDIPADHPVRKVLGEHDISLDEDLIVLRRSVGKDGRSRAYINDQSVSVGLLRQAGSALVEVHGQFDAHGLMDQATHINVLDRFRRATSGAEHDNACRRCWETWRAAHKAWQAAARLMREAKAEEEELRAAVGSLSKLAPVAGEEADLAAKRALLRHGEQILTAIETARQALTEHADVDGAVRTAQGELERAAAKAEGRLDAVCAALERASIELAEAQTGLDAAAAAFDLDPGELESAEERLFALKAEARKHKVSVDDLADHLAALEEKLVAVEGGEDNLIRLAKAEQTARNAFETAAKAMSKARAKAGSALAKAVSKELAPVKLDQASFRVAMETLPDTEWSTLGCDRVVFEVATNPGLPPGPLNKIASGGELARFLLALKVVLADSQPPAVMVFDEVDSGIGGATASAVGERLARLAEGVQVLVVTHSPQVAARGRNHWRVAKVTDGKITATRVVQLTTDERREEIARMLAGSNVTNEARAAASILMTGS
ncbi:MAG: DNA repair protein RecN [Rhodospirillaceae bacterium]